MISHFDRRLLLVPLAMLALSGCGPAPGELRENRDPLVRKARELRSAGEIERAVDAYNAALDQHGDMAQAHFELAAIYHQDRKEHIRAIYHYERFLDLNPNSQKKMLVLGEIQRAKMEYAASLPDRPSDAVQTIAGMEKERELLKARIAELQQQVDQLKARPVQAAVAVDRSAAAPGQAAVPSAPPAAKSTNATPAAATYQVQPGDTLAKIARLHYRDAGMAHTIYEANRSILKSERDLRPGQKLTLPPKSAGGG